MRFATWTEEEQLALLRIVDDLYRADGHYAAEELEDFRQKLSISAVYQEDLEHMSPDKAMGILKEDPGKLDLACTILAEAVYSEAFCEKNGIFGSVDHTLSVGWRATRSVCREQQSWE